MTAKKMRMRDAFTFSLGGMSAKSPYILTPAVAHDRINKALDERLRQAQQDQPDTARELSSWGRFWLRAKRRAA